MAAAGAPGADAEPLPSWFVRRWGAPAVIAGTVYRDGHAASDVAVTLRSSLTHAGREPERTARTDADGHFSFGAQPPASYVVTAAAPDRIVARVDVDLGRADPVPAPDRLELHLGRCEAQVRGVVRDASGGPIVGASVASSQVGRLAGRDVITDETGHFSLCVARGVRTVAVTASGYGSIERVVAVTGVQRLDVAMSPAATIEGVVVDPAGAPVPNASVRLSGQADAVERVGAAIAISDAQGRFQLETAPGAVSLLAFDGDGWAPSLAFELQAGELARVVLRLRAGAPISGRVLMAGEPVANVDLHAWSGLGFADARTGTDGTFTFPSGPVGDVRVTARAHRVIAGGAITVPASGVRNVVIEVAPLARIQGQAVRRGAAAAAARVSLRGAGHTWEVITDRQGRFCVDALEAGSYELTVVDDGGLARTATSEVELGDGEDRDLGVLELAQDGRVGGQVVDDRGQAVLGAFVSIGGAGATTDEEGRFELSGLALATLPVAVYLGGVAMAPIGPAEPITLTPARPSIADLAIAIRVRRGHIAGRVVDAGGAPRSDVEIQVRAADDPSGWSFVATAAVTDAAGRFRIDDLVAGEHAVRAVARGGGSVVATGVVAPRDDIELELDTDGAIEGRAVGFAGPVEVLVYGAVDQRARRTRIDGAAFRLDHVTAGDYLVSVRGTGASAIATVHVGAGETVRPVIAGRATRVVTGTVRELGARASVAGLWCVAGPRAAPVRAVWYARGPTDAAGRFEIEVGDDDVEVDCPGGAVFVDAARAGGGDVWTLRRGGAVAPLGVFFADPLVPRIAQVTPGGAAARAGMRAGDVIAAVDEQALDGIGTAVIAEYLQQRGARGPVAVTLLRDETLVTVTMRP